MNAARPTAATGSGRISTRCDRCSTHATRPFSMHGGARRVDRLEGHATSFPCRLEGHATYRFLVFMTVRVLCRACVASEALPLVHASRPRLARCAGVPRDLKSVTRVKSGARPTHPEVTCRAAKLLSPLISRRAAALAPGRRAPAARRLRPRGRLREQLLAQAGHPRHQQHRRVRVGAWV